MQKILLEKAIIVRNHICLKEGTILALYLFILAIRNVPTCSIDKFIVLKIRINIFLFC
jgi:hypothetical protein